MLDDSSSDPSSSQFDFNATIAKAAKVKEAQLKNKPGRRQWEDAAQFMKWTCGEWPEVTAVRAKPFKDRLQDAINIKSTGNNLYKQGQYQDAVLNYSKAISVFWWFQRNKDKSIEQIPLMQQKFSKTEEQSQMEQFLQSCFLNTAIVLCQQEQYQEARYACNMALGLNDQNAKAYYRRAITYQAENSSYMLELAFKDSKTAYKLCPQDQNIKKLYLQLGQEWQTQNIKDKRTFSGLFQRGDIYNVEEMKKQQLQKQQSAVECEQQLLNQLPADIFSEEDRLKAEELGLDLDDPVVLKMLYQEIGKHNSNHEHLLEKNKPGPLQNIQFIHILLFMLFLLISILFFVRSI